jgi:hypothetical protein
MKNRTATFVLASIAGLCALAVAQPAKEAPKAPAQPAADAHHAQPEMDEMMQQWMALATPNEHHARFSVFVGEWDSTVTMFEPGQDPSVSKGVMVNTLIHGGRYVHHEYRGDFMGMPFTGSGTFGYNNATKQYEGTWMDSMSTGIMSSTGTYDEATKTYNTVTSMYGPGGVKIPGREVIVVHSNDSHSMEMYHTMPGMPEMKAMEIKYTRKAAGHAAPSGH